MQDWRAISNWFSVRRNKWVGTVAGKAQTSGVRNVQARPRAAADGLRRWAVTKTGRSRHRRPSPHGRPGRRIPHHGATPGPTRRRDRRLAVYGRAAAVGSRRLALGRRDGRQRRRRRASHRAYLENESRGGRRRRAVSEERRRESDPHRPRSTGPTPPPQIPLAPLQRLRPHACADEVMRDHHATCLTETALVNTRAKRRTAGVSPASPLRVGQAARLPATEQIHTAAQEEHREEQQRDLRKGR